MVSRSPIQPVFVSFRSSLVNSEFKGLVRAVQVVDDPDRRPVLRVMITDTRLPHALVKNEAFLRRACKILEPFSVAARSAFNCVSCGRAACTWEIVIPGTRQFEIFTMVSEESGKPRPEDGDYPILSMIKSFELKEESARGGP